MELKKRNIAKTHKSATLPRLIFHFFFVVYKTFVFKVSRKRWELNARHQTPSEIARWFTLNMGCFLIFAFKSGNSKTWIQVISSLNSNAPLLLLSSQGRNFVYPSGNLPIRDRITSTIQLNRINNFLIVYFEWTVYPMSRCSNLRHLSKEH